jgi:membrane dipeptidase
MRKGIYILICVFLLYWIATLFVPAIIEKGSNPVKSHPPYEVSKKALDLFNSLDFVADLHCDALLWGRDLSKRSDYGHVDFPRMQEGNIALQVFTIVSKSPKGQNMETNSADAMDNITLLNIAQGRPVSNWFSLMNRTIYQSYKLREYSKNFNNEFILIKSKDDVLNLIEARKTNKKIIAGLLGIEGAHALEGTCKIWKKCMKPVFD